MEKINPRANAVDCDTWSENRLNMTLGICNLEDIRNIQRSMKSGGKNALEKSVAIPMVNLDYASRLSEQEHDVASQLKVISEKVAVGFGAPEIRLPPETEKALRRLFRGADGKPKSDEESAGIVNRLNTLMSSAGQRKFILNFQHGANGVRRLYFQDNTTVRDGDLGSLSLD